MKEMKKVTLTINGVQRSVMVDSEKVLIDLLREDFPSYRDKTVM